jgi:ABC-type lipoprotein export system ATPase subunit
MIAINNLSYAYATKTTFKFPDFSIKDGETAVILGKSGVGKTTLLHLLAALLIPKTGSIQINNTDIGGLSNKELTIFRAKNIGVIYQKPHFVNALTVRGNLELCNYLADIKLNEGHLLNLAVSLGFQNHLSKKTSQLSLGEQQRVSIARALMNKPSVIFADEPTSSLDDENCNLVIDLLQKHASEIGASLIIVTHDQRLKSVFKNQITLL